MIFLWVILYGLTYTLSQALSRSAGIRCLPPLLMGLYVGLFILWLLRTGRSRSIGLCTIHRPRGLEWAEFLPLFLMPALNLLNSGAFASDIWPIILMLSLCTAEEIFFRGFVLHLFTKYDAILAVVLSSGVFALFHLVNLVGGQDLTYTLIQVLYAFILSICYGAIALRFGSILPTIAAHILTNITAPPFSPQGNRITSWLWICIAVYSCFGILLCFKIRQNTCSK